MWRGGLATAPAVSWRTPASAAVQGRRLHADVIPLLFVERLSTVASPANSFSRPPGATAALCSPSCCLGTRARHLAPTAPGSFRRSPAYSTYLVPHHSEW